MNIGIKRLIMGMALTLMMVGGGFIDANAQCATCQQQYRTPVVQPPAQATCQGAYHFGPVTPLPFGVGGASGG